jgi:phospholipid/cholesterol/gamma-HCH transport system substrate-binding protein
MKTAIRKNLRNFIAIAVLFLIAIATSYYIVQEQRLRIPILEAHPFTLHAEFQTAQAVVPGQGQSIDVAGVKVGDVQSVTLKNGVADVTFGIDPKYVPIYRNATVLLRPRTGLDDMFFELDPGSKSAGEIPDGGTIPLQNTAPDVNLDEVLSALDGDTRAYLRILIDSGGQGLKGQSQNLGKLLGGLGPINKDLNRLTSLVAERRQNLANLIHNLSVLTADIGRHSSDVTTLVRASNSTLGAIAQQDPNVQRAVAELPGVLAKTRASLNATTPFAQQLGPTFNSLRPFARRLPQLNSSLINLSRRATPAIKNQIRPLVRAAHPAISPLRLAANRFSTATPRLTVATHELNRFLNEAAYNPHGANAPGTPGRDEGYLYWLGWAAHIGALTFATQDAHGAEWRVYLTASCANLRGVLDSTPAPANILAPLITGFDRLLGTQCPIS